MKMNPSQWLRKLLFKVWHNYGYVVYIPNNDDWSRFIERRLGGDTGLHGDPKNEYRVTRNSQEFAISKEILDWAIEQKTCIKFHVDVDVGNATYPRDRHLTLSFIFMTQADASHFKLTFL
jgi:hypothetical protein